MAALNFQDMISALNAYWAAQGCVLMQPYHTEVGAGTFNPATTLRSLTGEGFSARYLADACNRSIDEAWNDAEEAIAAAATRQYSADVAASLDANIRVVHGAELLADSRDGEDAMCARFETWIREHYPMAQH